MLPWRCTWYLDPPPHGQADLPVASGRVHQVNDVAVWFTSNHHLVHGDELVTRLQSAIPLGRGVLNDGPNDDLCEDQVQY